jgi:TolB protein
MMNKLGFWVVVIVAMVSAVITLDTFARQPLAGDNRIVVKVQRRGLLNPFVIPQDLYTIGVDGTGEINEKPPRGLRDEAEWSPNGEWIVYSTLNNFWGTADTSDIYLIRSDGSNRKRLTSHRMGGSFNPAWSTDGTKIAYFAYDKDGNNDGIYVMNVACLLHGEKCVPIPRFLVGGRNPDWSPDGKFIVYEPFSPENGFGIIKTDGTDKPTVLPLPEVRICFHPRWSPDGTRIAMSCYQEASDNFNIFVVNPDGSNVLALTDGSMPSWSPDGSKIVFTSRRGELGECIAGLCGSGGVYSSAVFQMNLDGSNVMRLSLRNNESVLWYTWVR